MFRFNIRLRAVCNTDTRIAVADEIGEFSELHRGGNARRFAVHNVADPGQFQGVDTVFTSDVVSAPRELLGQDRAAHQQDGDTQRC